MGLRRDADGAHNESPSSKHASSLQVSECVLKSSAAFCVAAGCVTSPKAPITKASVDLDPFCHGNAASPLLVIYV